MSEPTVFFHKDLDGVVSYLVLCWAINKKPNYIATTPLKLEEDYDKWSQKNPNDTAIFLDLDVSKIGAKIDKPTTKIFDHHKTNLYDFQHAQRRIYNETSCAKLIYDTLFKDKPIKITSAQKTLVALADDWDSNKRTTPISEELNIVYHSLTNKVESFIEDYYYGFVPFDKFKKNTILLYKKHRSEYLNNLQPFLGKVEFDGQKVFVGSVFSTKYVQECCDFLIQKHKVDVAIAVLLEQKRIAVRRSPNNTTVDVSKFVQRIANGGGHETAAGGNLTDEFIEFTKMLKPLEDFSK
jgi:oligoribonuclease NrnB/cAMP/cGMP phosphodiesterase (DHH superfamily)